MASPMPYDPPRADEEEREFLGSILLDSKRMAPVAGKLSPKDFFDPDLRRLYTVCLAEFLCTNTIDIVTVCKTIKNQGGILSDDSIPAWLASLTDTIGVAAHAGHYANAIREAASKRRILTGVSEALASIGSDSVSDITGMLSRISEEQSFLAEETTGEEVGISVEEAYENLLRASRTPGIDGIPTGFAHLDRKLGGLRDRELTIIAARPGLGKTSLAVAMAANMAIRSNLNVLFFTLEMSSRELAERLICSEARADSHEIKNGVLGDQVKGRLLAAATQIKCSPLRLVDQSSITTEEITGISRHRKRLEKLDCIIIDYIQIITWGGDSSIQREQQVTKQAVSLKSLAKELDIPIIALAQINRDATSRNDHRPKVSDLRESGGIEQAADNILMLHSDSHYDKDDPGNGIVTLYIEKQRNGPTGQSKLGWRASCTRFYETFMENK